MFLIRKNKSLSDINLMFLYYQYYLFRDVGKHRAVTADLGRKERLIICIFEYSFTKKNYIMSVQIPFHKFCYVVYLWHFEEIFQKINLEKLIWRVAAFHYDMFKILNKTLSLAWSLSTNLYLRIVRSELYIKIIFILY